MTMRSTYTQRWLSIDNYLHYTSASQILIYLICVLLSGYSDRGFFKSEQHVVQSQMPFKCPKCITYSFTVSAIFNIIKE